MNILRTYYEATLESPHSLCEKIAVLYFVEFGKVLLEVVDYRVSKIQEKLAEYCSEMGFTFTVTKMPHRTVAFEVTSHTNQHSIRYDFPNVVQLWFE